MAYDPDIEISNILPTIDSLMASVLKGKVNMTPTEIQNIRGALSYYSYRYYDKALKSMSLQLHVLKADLDKLFSDNSFAVIKEAKTYVSSNREGYDLAEKRMSSIDGWDEKQKLYKSLKSKFEIESKMMDKVDQFCHSLK